MWPNCVTNTLVSSLISHEFQIIDSFHDMIFHWLYENLGHVWAFECTKCNFALNFISPWKFVSLCSRGRQSNFLFRYKMRISFNQHQIICFFGKRYCKFLMTKMPPWQNIAGIIKKRLSGWVLMWTSHSTDTSILVNCFSWWLLTVLSSTLSPKTIPFFCLLLRIWIRQQFNFYIYILSIWKVCCWYMKYSCLLIIFFETHNNSKEYLLDSETGRNCRKIAEENF